MKSTAYLSIIFVLLSAVSSAADGSTLRGELKRFGKYGITPASSVEVTLCSDVNKKEPPRRAISDSEGVYYFDNIEAGIYILKVWLKDYNNKEKSIDTRIRIPNNKPMKMKTILTHSLRFEIPKKGRPIYVGAVPITIKPRGTYYSHPSKERAFFWLVFTDQGGLVYYKLSPVVINRKDGTWKTNKITLKSTDYKLTKIEVLMMTEKVNEMFKEKVKKFKKEEQIVNIKKDIFKKFEHIYKFEEIEDIRKICYILASRDIKIKYR